MKYIRVFSYEKLDGTIREEPVDLHQCIRFFLRSNLKIGDHRVYYLTPDGRWIEESVCVSLSRRTGMWRKFYCYISESISVAHDFLMGRGSLPVELEQYREIASNSEKFSSWLITGDQSRNEKNRSDRPEPRWDLDSRTLYYGPIECRVYKRRADNQFKILDEFQNQGWPASITNPLRDEIQLEQTIRDFNGESLPGSPLRLKRTNRLVKWVVNTSRVVDSD